MWAYILSNKLVVSTLLLIIVYTVGVVGVILPEYRPIVLPLTPINLVFTLVVFLWNEEKWSLKAVLWMFIIGFLGWLIEAIGTNTSLIFGAYQYLETLGWSIYKTPLAMFINWLILMYASVVMIQKTNLNRVIKSILGALLMVSLDYLIEPVAVALRFWVWSGDQIPLQNYAAWFVIAFIFNIFYYQLNLKLVNKLAPVIFIIQVAFFGILSFFVK